MRNAFVLVSVLMALVVTGCGQKKLTDEQKAIVSATIESAGRTHQSVPGAPATLALPVVNRFHALSFLSGTAGSRSAALTTDPTTIEMQEKLADELCQVDYSVPVSTSATSFNIKIQVSDKPDVSCPISMNIEMKGSGSETEAKVAATLKYEVKDDEFRKLNDVDKFDLSGEIAVKATTSTSGGSIVIEGEVKGDVHSQTKGDVKFELQADVEMEFSSTEADGSGSVALKLEYADFSAELKQSFDGTETKYEINGEEVSEADFQAYFTKAGVSVPGSDSVL
ncbi:MAG: hypothetical protein A2X94_06870 [Bdellovibrionales bacterium GWB1_55_8]|nr:MAG: hypothetical protein A2X94_06870 [Bdellovibrionales bacterium GWB1_55_8]